MTLYGDPEWELSNAPEVLRRQLESTKPVLASTECIAAVGAGDSYAAAVALEACSRGRAWALDPLDAVSTGKLERLIRNGCTLVALSVGGRTRAVLEAARIYRSLGGIVVAVTGSDTPLARLADGVIELTYTRLAAGIGALRHLVMLAALAASLGENPGPIETPNIDCNALWAGIHAGAGEAYSSALFAVLKLYEVYGRPARYERLEQLVHAPVYSTDSVTVYESSIAPAGRQKEVVDTLHAAGLRVYTVPCSGGCWGTVLGQALAVLKCLQEAARRDGIAEPRYRSHPGLERLTRLIYE
ncbi:hypothetical protein Pyrde_0271 [Pyrodictium delaneyi]|uniref:SIS domain-containing protein n=1 Tax=Pyrodictium delaneyi TaxID=1273541 RepID=A0A0N7JCT9_9CREN|nr:hypothetical protein [Pyrodictium delaneyi]ALL00321.1 hypothetical protein Pyrde_0271 [Pyrodictium delaneyi]OWJ54385.1 hypothetical protein Pdsh_07900 [Pyrodictium delaneyi]